MITQKAQARYYPDTNSMMIVFDEGHGPTISEEVAYDVIAIYNESDHHLVAIELISGAKELFSDLVAKVSGEQATLVQSKAPARKKG